jgi:membrane protein required for colicin V production
MPSYLDLGVLGIILVSALLSMMRGFTREVLAIGSWAAAAAAAYYFYPAVMPYATPYVHKEIVAQAISAAVVFFAMLIVVSLFTVRLSDAILDSKIGALDRSLGFLFGAARGFLLGVVAFSIFNWLVAEKQQPEWVQTAKTRPALVDTANWIIALLPDDAAATIEGWIKAKNASAVEEPSNEAGAGAAPAPAPALAPAPSPAPAPAKTTGATAPAAGATPADKQKLDSLINRGVPMPAPAAPAIVPTPLRR